MSDSSRHGNFIAYLPEFDDPDTGKWEPVPTSRRTGGSGVKFPFDSGGICQEISMYGEAQAWALAWGFAAEWAATHYDHFKVRIVAYDVKFDIEATKRVEPDET